ncbi:MAG: hydrogenase maturation nickel metallochaperone HypA [Giesbergeria sp.]
MQAPDALDAAGRARATTWPSSAQPAAGRQRLRAGCAGAGWRRGAIAWCEMAQGAAGALAARGCRRAASSATRVLAPTEWNFHPQGAAAQVLRQLPSQRAAAADVGPAVGLLVAAFDPCVEHDAGRQTPLPRRAWPVHELSLAGGVLKLVEDTALREPFTRVLQLRLEVGKLAAVEVGAALRSGVPRPGQLAGRRGVGDRRTSAQAWCMDCSQRVEIEARGDPCPVLRRPLAYPQSGEALRVVDMQVV